MQCPVLRWARLVSAYARASNVRYCDRRCCNQPTRVLVLREGTLLLCRAPSGTERGYAATRFPHLHIQYNAAENYEYYSEDYGADVVGQAMQVLNCCAVLGSGMLCGTDPAHRGTARLGCATWIGYAVRY
eukprot:1572206-Rhodomonas_salina.1